MTRGMHNAVTPKKSTFFGKAKAITKVVGIGLAAGIALISITDKAMTKAFPPEEKGEEKKSEETETK